MSIKDYKKGPYGLEDIVERLEATATTNDQMVQKSPSILIVDQLRKAVEAESGGKQTVIYTAKKQPCIMNVIPRFLMEDLPGWDTEDGTGTHPAFIFNGVEDSEIFIGAYQASEVAGEAISQPMVYPRNRINYDQARALCQANGPGWDMMSNLDWAAIALWCMANDFQPRGNTQYGRHHDSRHETGRVPAGATIGSVEPVVPHTLTGSGPNTWRHDNSPSGISDLVGNVGEWVSGMKLVDGRAWVAPDNGQTEESQLIDSGFDMPSERTWATVDATGASDLLKQSLIVPTSPELAPVGKLFITAEGECLPLRGGHLHTVSDSGLGTLGVHNIRTYSAIRSGFRPRFRNL